MIQRQILLLVPVQIETKRERGVGVHSCLYTHVSMGVCMSLPIRKVHMLTYTHLFIYSCVYGCMYVSTYSYVHLLTYTHLFIYSCVYGCMYAHTCARLNICYVSSCSFVMCPHVRMLLVRHVHMLLVHMFICHLFNTFIC